MVTKQGEGRKEGQDRGRGLRGANYYVKATGIFYTAQGIWPIFYNDYKWSITFTNCEYYTAHLKLILQINYTPVRASLVAQTVKTLPAIQETQLQFLGWENPLQYSCLENSIDRGSWQVIVYGVAKSRT